jgi:hypothetical protein
MATILAAEKDVGALSSLSEKITDDQERRAFRKQLAEVMVLYADMIVSIARQYPDLDPDKRDRGAGRDD